MTEDPPTGAYGGSEAPARPSLRDRFRGRLRIPSFRRKRAEKPEPAAEGGAKPVRRRRALRIGLWAVPSAIVLYYGGGMALTDNIRDDLGFGIEGLQAPEGGSRSAAMAAALLRREAVEGHWVANDPWFVPASQLDNMPNYQQGIVAALARYAFELTDQIGRVRGSSRTDPDLQEAAGLLQYSGTKWVFDFSTSIAPTATSEAQYAKAMRSLLTYNDRLAAGEAVFETRADNLLATLDRIALDIGSSSATIEEELINPGGWIDTRADDIFYGIKGQVYAYYLILRELKADFANIVSERELGAAYDHMLDSMRQVVEVDPWFVVSGDPDALFEPSHLAAQGFFLLRARAQLREITAILRM